MSAREAGLTALAAALDAQGSTAKVTLTGPTVVYVVEGRRCNRATGNGAWEAVAVGDPGRNVEAHRVATNAETHPQARRFDAFRTVRRTVTTIQTDEVVE